MQITKLTFETRLEEGSNIEEFHHRLQDQATQGGYQLTSFGYSEKERKVKGEVEEVWYIVKYTFVFNDPKDIDKNVSVEVSCLPAYGAGDDGID